MKSLQSLDLFSGIGGMSLALRDVCITQCYCEIDQHCANVLRKLMKKGVLCDAPIEENVLNLHYSPGLIDIITGGFPCQGFSTAGKRQGFQHDESRLFWEVIRLTREAQPLMVFLENSPAVCVVIEEIANAFHTENYDLHWIQVSAEDVGALHLRKRWFALALRRNDARLGQILHELSKLEPGANFWSLNQEPPRAVKYSKGDPIRRSMLGNSVVPGAARYAFILLCKQATLTKWKPGCNVHYGLHVNGILQLVSAPQCLYKVEDR